MSSPALTLAATLQRKAAKLGLPVDDVAPETAAVLAAGFEERPSLEAAGALLWTLVDVLRAHDLDAETALRARARQFRDRLAALEADA
jgi:XTP/dITP diphosphohydrolase